MTLLEAVSPTARALLAKAPPRARREPAREFEAPRVKARCCDCGAEVKGAFIRCPDCALLLLRVVAAQSHVS